MTVAELIKALDKFPYDMEVKIHMSIEIDPEACYEDFTDDIYEITREKDQYSRVSTEYVRLT